MGFETANVHVGTQKSKAILSHLGSAGKKWLDNAANEMAKAVEHDWKTWASAAKTKKSTK